MCILSGRRLSGARAKLARAMKYFFSVFESLRVRASVSKWNIGSTAATDT